MKYSDIKVGMKVKLITQKIGDHEDYRSYKVGDVCLVYNEGFSLRRLSDNNETYCIPPGSPKGDRYSRFWEPVIVSLKELLE